jgi:acyl-coenzyme A synthetase/AMP-(fatty) acid ligase
MKPAFFDYIVAESMETIGEIPRTGSGKIIRYKLRELIKV